MSRFLRWQILIPRLLVVAIVVLAAHFGVGFALRTATIRSGQLATGRPVEVGSTRVSVGNRQVVLSHVRLANPQSPLESVLDAERCELDVATKPLLKKQLVVEHGRVTGLRFSVLGSSESSAQLTTEKSVSTTKWFRDEADIAASDWFVHLAETFRKSDADQFESVKRTAAFCEDWSTQSAALEARGVELDRRATTLQESVAAAQANPLRNDKFLTGLPTQIAELQKDFAEFDADLAKLPDQLELGRRAIVAARRGDEALVAKRLTLQPVAADAISAYMMRAAAVKPLDELIGWLRWVREAVPAGPKMREKRSRGEDILFAGCPRVPNLLVRAMELQGSGRIANQPVELRGTLTDFVTEPALHNEPMRLRITTTGSMPLELQATIDRTRGAAHDALLMDCQGVLLPRLSLGHADQIEMAIAPSLASLSVSVAVEGEKLTGDIQMVQQNVRIVPGTGGDFAKVPISGPLEETLGRIDSLATRISLGGTLQDPHCTLWSNLGPAVAEAMQHAIQRAGGEHARGLLADAGKQGDERLTVVERQMTEQQTRWATRIAAAGTQLQAVATTETPRDRISPDRLGRRLPTNSLFR